jgi:hypothetical protein
VFNTFSIRFLTSLLRKVLKRYLEGFEPLTFTSVFTVKAVVTVERDKKLDMMEWGKVKAEDSCGNDANLPEGWTKGGAKKLLVREPGELRDESSEEHHQDLPDGWKVKTPSPSKTIPPVSTVQHKVESGNFMERSSEAAEARLSKQSDIEVAYSRRSKPAAQVGLVPEKEEVPLMLNSLSTIGDEKHEEPVCLSEI